MSVSAERMTPRARSYLVIAAMRHAFTGIWCVAMPSSFDADSYNGLKMALTPVPPDSAMAVWGILLIGVALLCAAAALVAREGEARWALMSSVCVTGLVAGGFVASGVTGHLAGPFAVSALLALTLKDLTMLRQPLRNPFEPLVRRSLANAARR